MAGATGRGDCWLRRRRHLDERTDECAAVRGGCRRAQRGARVTVDAALDGGSIAAGLAYRVAIPAIAASPGRHRFDVLAPGRRPLSFESEVAASEVLLVVAWPEDRGVGVFSVRAGLPTPPSGQAMVRLVNALPGAPDLVVRDARGRVLGEPARVGSANPFIGVEPGLGVLDIVAGSGAPVARVSPALAAGSVTTLVVTGDRESIPAVTTILDAVGQATVPGVPDTGGGPAARPELRLVLGAAVAAAAALVAARAWRRPTAALALVLAAGSLVACGTAISATSPVPQVGSTTQPARVLGGGETKPAASSDPAAPPVPVGIDIPRAGVHAEIVPVQGLASADFAGKLDSSRNQRTTAGWYAPGQVGPAIIVGHIDWNGPAVPARTKATSALPPGTFVDVTLSDGSVLRFVIRSVAQYAKATFPADVAYAPAARAELRPITAEGSSEAGTTWTASSRT